MVVASMWKPPRLAVTKKSRAYRSDLIESVRDASEAEEYLNAALEEDDSELFLVALRTWRKHKVG